jgi:hypothetical protein
VAIQIHLDEIDKRLERIENAVTRKVHVASINPTFGSPHKSNRRT